MLAEILALRLIHVVGGTFWVGSGLYNAFFLMPSVQASGPGGGAVMANLQRRRLFVVLPTVAILTILSGLRLMWIVSGGFEAAYFATGRGASFAVSGAAAIVAFALAMAVTRPAMIRMGTLRQSLAGAEAGVREAIDAELFRLDKRSGLVGRVVTVLLLVSAIGMAIGRYVP